MCQKLPSKPRRRICQTVGCLLFRILPKDSDFLYCNECTQQMTEPEEEDTEGTPAVPEIGRLEVCLYCCSKYKDLSDADLYCMKCAYPFVLKRLLKNEKKSSLPQLPRNSTSSRGLVTSGSLALMDTVYCQTPTCSQYNVAFQVCIFTV